MSNVTKQWKDTLFRRFMLDDTERLISFTNAVNDTNYSSDTPIELCTLDGNIFGALKNDISFVIDNKLTVLVEHQSSWNPNMSVRMFLYAAELLRKRLSSADLFSTHSLEIPAIQCIVVYNGLRELRAEDGLLKLSSLVPDSMRYLNDVELRIHVISIKSKDMDPILSKCKYVRSYTTLVESVQANYDLYRDIDKAVTVAIEDYSELDAMHSFLQKYLGEVRSLLSQEFDQKLYDEVRRREALEDGRQEGRREGRREGRQEGRQEGEREGKRKVFNSIASNIVKLYLEQKMSKEAAMLSLNITESQFDTLLAKYSSDSESNSIDTIDI